MLVKVNTSLAGHHFSFPFGHEVDSEEFSALVGNGWQNLCDPIGGQPVPEHDIEIAVERMPKLERRVRRK